ncbi:MAG: hypothetical protein LBS21_06820 [Clostridiales bacterium]|nr:hypothetical protein [Clostridiales bacterium]
MKYTKSDWIAEGERRFGEDRLNWKFVCPACGRINTGQEFKDAGAEPNNMYSACIGRHSGNMRPAKKTEKDGNGCDWVAWGFLGTLGKGNIVINDDGAEVEVFAFADATGE